MITAPQRQQEPRAAAQPAEGNGQRERDAALLNQMLDKEIEYTPFMAKDPIKLSARLVRRFLCKPTKSGKVCDERDAIRFVMLCQARGLNPWEGDAFIVGYDSADGAEFNLITAHQAFLKRAEVHPHYDGMQSGVLVRRKWIEEVDGRRVERSVVEEIEGDYFDEGALVGGWARVHRKDLKYPTIRRLKLETFNKGFSRWKADPAGMIVKCAEADALRSAFPNSLGGMYLQGEMTPDDTPAQDGASEPPAPGRHSLRNGNGAAPYQPAPPEPTEAESRAAQLAREALDELGTRLDLAETAAHFQEIGADALRQRAALGEENYAAFLRHYQERFSQVVPAREPGE